MVGALYSKAPGLIRSVIDINEQPVAKVRHHRHANSEGILQICLPLGTSELAAARKTAVRRRSCVVDCMDIML